MRFASYPLLVPFLLCTVAGEAMAQSPAEHIAEGDSLLHVLRPQEALAHYHAALGADSTNATILWKTARATIDIAKQIAAEDGPERKRRDSLYIMAKGYAERAIQGDSANAEAHYALALALGRLSRTLGGRDRLRYGRTIREEAVTTLALSPNHDGAHHILGAWNAEVKRLSGLTRFFAKSLLGAGFLSAASWDSATMHLERAVALNPTYVYHHLELAEIYIDINRRADAIRELEMIPQFPDGDVLDPEHRRRAVELLKELHAK